MTNTILLVLIVFSISIISIISIGEIFVMSHPKTKFSQWWKRNVINKDPN